MDIFDTLENGPARMASSATAVVLRRAELREAEHKLKVAQSKATIKYGTTSKNAQEAKARTESDKEVMEAEAKVITLKGAVELAEIPHDKEEKEFMSAHTLAKMDRFERNAWNAQTVHE